MQICNSILEAVGKTPLVKLHRVVRQLKCTVYAKCEFFNPAGSVKDRIALKMIEKAEKEGRIKPGDTLIEPSSGNTGLGMALAGAVKGYKVIITMPEKMSREKQVVLEALGAMIIRTPTEAAWDAPESHISVAKKMQKELPNAHILDQYANPNNPEAHYEGTAQEILEALDNKVDMVVMGAGTGGTITGVSKKIKEVNPNCRIIGVDPVGSILGGGNFVGSYKVEGIGYDFIPKVLNKTCVDKWVKTNDRQTFMLARQLIRTEGILCGGSSGAALYGVLQEAKDLREDQNCVVILPDGIRNYMTKFIDDKWMEENRFTKLSSLEGKVSALGRSQGELFCLNSEDSCASAIQIMKERGFSQIPVTQNGQLVGMLREQNLLENLLSGQDVTPMERVEQIMDRNVTSVNLETPLSSVEELLLDKPSVIVVNEKMQPQYILTKIDLVEYLSSINKKS